MLSVHLRVQGALADLKELVVRPCPKRHVSLKGISVASLRATYWYFWRISWHISVLKSKRFHFKHKHNSLVFPWFNLGLRLNILFLYSTFSTKPLYLSLYCRALQTKWTKKPMSKHDRIKITTPKMSRYKILVLRPFVDIKIEIKYWMLNWNKPHGVSNWLCKFAVVLFY